MDTYICPYLVCRKCNSINFINVQEIRSVHESSVRPSYDSPWKEDSNFECLSYAASTIELGLGVNASKAEYVSAKQDAQKYARKVEAGARLVQRMFRGYAGRKKCKSMKREIEQAVTLQRVATTKIQAVQRGIISRRILVVQQCLTIIQEAHNLLRNYALQNNGHYSRVVWYTDEDELKVLYWDYREFVYRTGNKPPLINVENNIIEIAKRILAREAVLVTRIQARWRGITGRIVMREINANKCWGNTIHLEFVIKIQRTYRRIKDTRRFRSIYAKRCHGEIKENYVNFQKLKAVGISKHRQRQKIYENYLKIHRQHRTARLGASIGPLKPDEKGMVTMMRATPLAKQMLKYDKTYVYQDKTYKAQRSITNQEPDSSIPLGPVRRFKDLHQLPKPVRKHRATIQEIIHAKNAHHNFALPKSNRIRIGQDSRVE